ncbi:MAG: ADOP family duplicated permease [Verrucomicrobia bacterium]|nr:ADOP family duplicated permease [Verrucomicrobiota bacterium]
MSLLRHGLTSLRRAPLLALTIVATLGVALAATVIVFSFLNSFLLRPLPYGDGSRLVVVYEHSLVGGRDNSTRVTYGNVVALHERATAFSRSGIFRNESATFRGADSSETAFVQRVTAEIFPMMGARAALGSVITPANIQTGGLRALVLSDSLWRRRFGADPTIVGRTIQLDQTSFQVVGVMPADFVVPTGDDSPQAWAALLRSDYDPAERTQRRHHFWGELAPGRSLVSAEAELATLAAQLRREFPRENADRGLRVVSLRDDLLGNFGRQLFLLQGAVLLVLTVACFNCLCLLIARAIQRRREFAVRLALGASVRHLLAQLFAESLWLAVPAAALACGLAALALPFGVSLLPPLGPLPAPQVDATVIAAVSLAAVGLAAIFSAVPLLQARRLNLEATLREGGRTAGSRGSARAARFLAAGQIAVALALLICGALLVRSQDALQRVDVGLPIAEFDQFRIGLRGDAYTASPARRVQFFERLRENLLTIPGVRDVGVASFLFSRPPGGYTGFVQEGDGLQLSDTPKRALPNYVLPSTLNALGFRLLDGRLLADTDDASHPPVAVISASVAAKYWPGQSPLGKRVRLDVPRVTAWAEVVGVVSDVIGTGAEPRVVDTFYLTIAQWTPPGLGMGFIVRHSGTAPDERQLQRAVAQIDPAMQLFAHLSPSAIYARSLWQVGFVTKLVGAFALIAVALSLAGIYAVNSFFVARRINEFGIRAALGATRLDLLQLVLRDSLRLTVAGLAAGALLAFAASRGLTNLLYNVPALDLLVYTAAALAMTLACAGATLLPARRAAKADPLTALRAE